MENKVTIKTYLWRCKKENSIWLFWILVNSVCVFLNGILSARAITTLVSFDLKGFILYSLSILAVNILWVIQIYQGAKANEKAIQMMAIEIRKDIALKLEQAGILNYEKKNQATYLSWLTNDINTIIDLGFETLELMVMQALNIVFAIVAFLSFHYSLLFTIAIFFLMMVKLPKLFAASMEKKAVTFTEKNEELVQAIDDVLSGYRNLSNANKIGFMTRKIMNFSHQYANAKIDYAKSLGGLMSVQNGTSFISQIVILIHSGVLYFYRLMPIGGVSSSQYFASIIFAGLTGLTANYTEFKSVDKIFEKFNAIDADWQLNNFSKPAGNISFVNGDISLNQLTLKREQQVVFEHLTLHFEKNKKYALTGTSGVGKSSLLKLIKGELFPDSGTISFNGISLLEIDRQSLNDNISYVSADDHIFNESLRFNLTLGKEVEQSEIDRVLDILHLKNWVSDLDKGLETRLSQITQDISSGQKQRILLARLLLEDKPVWLIDEGTSAIDKDNRKLIEEELLKQPNKTILFVTHHLSETLAERLDSQIHLDDFVAKH
ncbi:ATP-binding cassette domain-containing protein [Streptococcus zalophi]|uniref:ABC transporter ATP-binding protein n=1 Tax=Streptococcus zalophi TaxID=640031 RepID=A0A934P963_9STRE|nr:ABC transporter ATP-binding protein [Streptococcus zalophi]MBJ8349287.1 ABC transporter ATP-binding protein [Streptococcus zalophi]